MKILLLCIMICTIFLGGCSNGEQSVSENESVTSETTNSTIDTTVTEKIWEEIANPDVMGLNWGMNLDEIKHYAVGELIDETDNKLTYINVDFYNYNSTTEFTYNKYSGLSKVIVYIDELGSFKDLFTDMKQDYGSSYYDDETTHKWTKIKRDNQFKIYLEAKDDGIICTFDLEGKAEDITIKTTTNTTFEPLVINKPAISKSEFDSLEIGMTYTECCKIIGSNGELSAESEIAGYRSTCYTFEGEGSIGANAVLLFGDNKLVSKAQTGLE